VRRRCCLGSWLEAQDLRKTLLPGSSAKICRVLLHCLSCRAVAVKTSVSHSPVIRFGVFELDLRSEELRKQGMKIRLQGKPVEILAVLLERPGEVVTREDLQKKLWPADTFVDFEQGLNNAMKRLRAALDDNAETPRFIETLPRRGYRFVGTATGAGAVASDNRIPLKNFLGSKQAVLSLAVFGALALVVLAATLVGMNVAGAGWYDRIFTGRSKPNIQSLAVLPLANLSADPEQEYFADGMTEALITELGKISGPRVISRQSVMEYKGSKKSLREIARELNVDAVLEGAVARSEGQVKVTVHLAQASPERQLWAQEYDRGLHDVLSLQDEIALAVTDEIRTKLTPEVRTRFSNAPQVNPEAYADYLHGRSTLAAAVGHLSKVAIKKQYTEQDIETAIAYFRQAIEKDPAYAQAYAGFAEAYIQLGNPVWGGHPPNETLSDAKDAAHKALELDPSLPEAHFSLAQTLQYDWNWPETEKEYKLALKLNPNYVDAHLQYGRFVQALGRNDEAMAQMRYADLVDPFNIGVKVTEAYVTYASRQYDLALKQFESLGDDFGLVQTYREKEMYPEAIAAWQRWTLGNPSQRRCPHCLATLAGIYGLEGRNDEAQALIAELRETARHRYVSGVFFAEAYIGLSHDQALTWLERAYEEHDQWMVFVNSYPGLDRLRSEPRFQALLRRMNFPQ
jgi:TolB-like protein/DNA-binding winged helix-turn-helix (wHTH) protein